jgi:parallel beta-helix repeat protein
VAKPTFIGGRISRNFAKSFGGGIYSGDQSESTFENVEISNNTCLNDGGAIYLSDSSSPNFIGCRFTQNNATSKYVAGDLIG